MNEYKGTLSTREGTTRIESEDKKEIMEWIAINDRLPEDKPNDTNIFITCDKDGFVYGSSNYFGGGCMDKDGFYNLVNGEWEYDEDVRFWMPLPEAAVETENNLT